jgi:hypothetical protein
MTKDLLPARRRAMCAAGGQCDAALFLTDRSYDAMRQFALVVALGAVTLIAAGCGGASPAGSDGQLRVAMKVLGLEYGAYLTEHNGAPPPDEAAMRAYLQARMPQLSELGVKGVDDLLRPGRDGQPIKVVYGAKIAMPDRPQYAYAAYEQSGVDGNRLVSDSRGGVYEMGDKEFTELFSGK